MNILYIGPILPEYVAIMKALLPQGYQLEVAESGSPVVWERVGEAHFLLALAPITEEIIRAAEKVRLIQVIGAGYDKIDVKAAHRAGILVATTGGANAVSVAEHALALILTLYRRIPYAHHSVKAGKWPQFALYQGGVFELSGKTLGLIGFGHTGQALARLVQGFDVRVLYYRRHRLPPDQERALGASYATLEDLLRQADIVSLHVPLTDQTRRLIGRKELGLMKKSAILINTSRGRVVDEEALIEWLSSGRIAGAGLDVFHQEPIDPHSPLLKLDNVVLTPHMAGASEEAVRRTFEAAFANVVRVAAGQQPANVVRLRERQ